MKHHISIFLILLLSLCSNLHAKNNGNIEDIQFVSYEQNWSDNDGTLSLRNNTSERVSNVSFIIEYYDMSGNQLDYREFSKRVDIAPGMTKKLNIPAYESDRQYYYYKSDGLYNNRKFKINFRLNSYKSDNTTHEYSPSNSQNSETVISTPQKRTASSDTEELSDGDIAPLIMLFAILIVFSIYIGTYVLVAVMAQRRRRSAVLWLLLSFIATPILAIIILLIIGKNPNAEYPYG